MVLVYAITAPIFVQRMLLPRWKVRFFCAREVVHLPLRHVLTNLLRHWEVCSMFGGGHQASLFLGDCWHKNKSHGKIRLQFKPRVRNYWLKGGSIMKMKTFMCALLALPALAFGQDMQVTKEKGTQAKTERVEKSAPHVKAQERNQTNVQVEPRFTERERNQTTVQTGPKAKFSERTTARVSRTEVIQRHPEFRERHDKVFFESRFGHHFRFFSPFNEYFVFVDGCWVAVDVDGFVFTDQVICPGDPNFVEVEIE